MSGSPIDRDASLDPAGRTTTSDAISRDLSGLGVQPGDLLLVHSSLRSIGWVDGGPIAVIDAFDAVLGKDGTLVMPTHTSQLCDPALRRDRPVAPDAIAALREALPVFDPLRTPTRGMGAIPECFRSLPGVLRSNHPHDSFAARGPYAQKIVSQHALHNGLGETSPLAALYDLGAQVLLLGVGHDSSTSLHLAENRASFRGKRHVQNGANQLVGNKRQWVGIKHLEYLVDDFIRIGRDYARATREMSCGFIGRGQSMLMPIRGLVDFAVRWMERNR